jgi:hypothetical protein
LNIAQESTISADFLNLSPEYPLIIPIYNVCYVIFLLDAGPSPNNNKDSYVYKGIKADQALVRHSGWREAPGPVLNLFQDPGMTKESQYPNVYLAKHTL